ncbi:MAG: Ig-like domain-containing protein, partial [Actinobacteria bacterium]|nr:Ig-like domain-containing protein [Actinomycetota bacterium]
MKHWRILTLFALLPLLAMLASCSSDDTTTPDEDTDAPVVVQVDPNQDETDVAVGEDVTIVFNEDMDPATADGNVTLSHGTITDLDWLDDKTLEVAHGDWPEGTEVTVTVGTGLADVAGNALAQAFAWSFWTWTNDVILQNTLPENGATGVPINTQVWLGFSRAMNGATLPGAITV